MSTYHASLLFIALASPFAAALHAQESTSGTVPELIVLEKFPVTGSNIPYAVDTPAVPVRIVTIDQIAATGEAGDLLEVIRKAAPQFVGNGNIGSSNSNIGNGSTNGGSQIKLRNVQTLVLINGRRAAFAPVGATGGFSFVDVNSIPVSAVQRIDILSDGASAIYGSDAVSGVVNIILKKDYEGVEVGGRYSVADRGGGRERSLRAITGHKVGNTSVTVSAEWVKSDPVYQSQRPFSADMTGQTSTFPGVASYYNYAALDPNSGEPGVWEYYLLSARQSAPQLGIDQTGAELVASGTYEGPFESVSSHFNLAPYVTLAVGNEKKSATLAFSHGFTPKLELFGDMLFSRTSTFSQLAAQPIVGMPFAAAHVSDFGAGVGFADPDHPQNPFDSYVLVRNRLLLHPRQYTSDTDTFRTLTGLRGQITEDWTWEGAVNYNMANQDYVNKNVLDRASLIAAIDSNALNMFAVEQGETALVKAGVFGAATSKNRSSLFSGDFHVNGSLRNLLPGGPIEIAIGTEYRRETLKATPDVGSYTITNPDSPQFGAPVRWDGANTTNPFSAKRTIGCAFAEVRVPITDKVQAIPGLQTLELDIAGRYDRYSDTDDPLVPKVTIRWLPFSEEFAVRATYARSFTAPELYSLFGPTTVGYTDQIINFERADGGTIVEADQAFARTPPNPTLEPEKGTTWNLGFVYTPKRVQGLSIEAGYFNIRQRDVAGLVNEFEILQDVEKLGAASQYADRVRIGGFAGLPITAPGQISGIWDTFQTFAPVYVTNHAENFISAEQDGIDVTVDYDFGVGTIGRLALRASGYWYHSYKVGDDQYVGTTNGQSVLNGGTVPRWLGSLDGTFTHGSWKAGFNFQYIPAVTDPYGETEADRHIQDFARGDLWMSYQFTGQNGWRGLTNGLTVRVGVNNVTNEMPPLAPASWTDANADTSTYGMLGRVYFVDASYKF